MKNRVMEIIVNSVSPLSRWREYTQIYCKWCNNKMNLKLRRESVCWKKTYECFFAFNDTLSFPTNPALVSDAVNFRYREEKIMFTTGDKLLNVMKEEEIGIAELARISGVPERTILDIMAGVKEPELGVMCKIAEELGICVHELRADEEHYAVSVPKDTLAKLIVVSEINNVDLEELINCILEKGIEEHGFYA